MKKILALVLALVLVLMCGAALAEWPERSIELIVPANPGGDTDANARALAAALNQEFGWDVVVSNMNGGSGAVAFDNLRENPDNGYRYVFYHSGGTIAQLMGMYDYSLTDDFCTVGMPFMDYSSAFLSNSANEKFNDIESLVAYMKEHPGEVTFATETGNFTHLHALAFQDAAGVEFKIVDAGTAANKITELLGNRLDIIDTQAGLVRDYLTTGEFINLGIMAEDRISGNTELKTIKEQGYDVVFPKYFYISGPADLDPAIINAFNEALTKVAANEALQSYAANALVEVTNKSPEDSVTYIKGQEEIYLGYLADYID
ncbi:MAG: tripartite tricarboxylate transporter substrate binding protein [Candidatus Limiplasma sp.]|nr:tripartite tricarboxylate transporter substrate binding protein [Candidatus Limiplasma sp.]